MSDTSKTETPDAPAAKPEQQVSRLSGKQLNVLLSSLLAVAIVVMVNYLAYRHYERFDWTSESRFTLSEQTEKVLKNLDQEVEIIVFMSEGEPNFADLMELLARYKAKNPKIQTRHVDPHRQPGEIRVLAERYDLQVYTEDGAWYTDVAAIATSGEKRWAIRRDDLISADLSGGEDEVPKVDVKSEQAISSALVQLSSGRQSVVCVTEGHGEWALADTGERGLSHLTKEYKRQNILLKSIDGVGTSKIDKECDALFVVAPQRAFSDKEAKSVADYVRGGGHALLALDPVLDGNQVAKTGFEEVARDFGIDIDQALVLELDQQRQLANNPIEAFLATNFGDHSTTKPVRAIGGAMFFGMARSVRPLPDAEGVSSLVTTTAESFGEVDLSDLGPNGNVDADAEDIAGPLSLAVAVEPGKGRLVVVGDADWMTATVLQEAQFANVDVLASWTGWLAERESMISIAPRSSSMASVVMTEGDIVGVGVRVLGLLPGAAFLLGLAVWWSRRS